MLSGHEISTDFCSIKVEGVAGDEAMRRKEENSLGKCREGSRSLSIRQNPHEAFGSPKHSRSMEVIQRRRGTKSRGLNVSV